MSYLERLERDAVDERRRPTGPVRHARPRTWTRGTGQMMVADAQRRVPVGAPTSLGRDEVPAVHAPERLDHLQPPPRPRWTLQYNTPKNDLGLTSGDVRTSSSIRFATMASFADEHGMWPPSPAALSGPPPERPRIDDGQPPRAQRSSPRTLKYSHSRNEASDEQLLRSLDSQLK